MKIRSKLILSAVAATLGCALLAGCGGAASSSTASSASPAASSVVLSQAALSAESLDTSLFSSILSMVRRYAVLFQLLKDSTNTNSPGAV